MNLTSRIFVSGHQGLIGSSLVEKLRQKGFKNLVTCSRKELDLTDQQAVARFYREFQPEYVFIAAGRSGGVYANNTYRAQYIYENLTISANLIHHAFLNNVKRLIHFSGTCVYPLNCPQPMDEGALLTGPLEPTTEPVAMAMLASWKMCESYNRQYGTQFNTLIVSNLYGPNQSYDLLNTGVLPALLRKTHEAKVGGLARVPVWGSGNTARDFLYTDDLAEAALFVMSSYEGTEPLNVASGEVFTIRELSKAIAQIVGFNGEFVQDTEKPEGVAYRSLDTTTLRKLGWSAQTPLTLGLQKTYEDFLNRTSNSSC